MLVQRMGLVSDPECSVIINTRNGARFLSASVASVLEQTFRDFELVIFDNASSDGTSEVVSRLYDERIRYIRSDQSLTLYAARNAALRKSSQGRYVAFLDVDDLWHPSKLQMQVGLLGRNRADLVYTAHSNFSESRALRLKPRGWDGREAISIALTRRNFIPFSSLMFRRDVFERFGYFDERFSIIGDYEFLLRIADRSKVDRVTDELTFIRKHPESFSSTHVQLHVNEIRELLGELDRGSGSSSSHALLTRALMPQLGQKEFELFFRQRQWSEAWKALRAATPVSRQAVCVARALRSSVSSAGRVRISEGS